MTKAKLLGLCGALTVLLLGVGAWIMLERDWLNPPLTSRPCDDSSAIESYDIQMLSIFGTQYEGYEWIVDIRVNGRMHSQVSYTRIAKPEYEVVTGGSERIYDGNRAIYTRIHPSHLFEVTDEEDSINWEVQTIRDDDFPFGAEYLCPDVEVLGAEYVERDEIGDKYVIQTDSEFSTYTLWLNDNGWLLQTEGYAGMTTTLSGIGEHNEIEIPPPPYYDWDDRKGYELIGNK